MQFDRFVLSLFTSSPNEAAAFYVSHIGMRIDLDLGWFISLRHDDHAELEIALTAHDHESVPEFMRRPASGLAVAFVVDDVDAHHARFVELGTTIIQEPLDHPWGQRQLLAQGPDDVLVDLVQFTRNGLAALHPQAELEQEPNMPVGHLASIFNAQGPNANCLTACAASSQAIGEATEIIRRGDADVMLSGGSHSMIHPFGVTGFNLLTALSTNNEVPQAASRPFDKNRDGFVLGEGAGMLVLEELERAKARGAKIYAEIAGYGSTADAFRITDTHPEGRGAIACIKMALNDAKLNTDQIDYVNAHGTSTSVNDRVETLAIKGALGDDARNTPVSSIKSMMGHLIAAAGSVEAITCILAMRDGVLPPTINYETPDPDCDLDYVPNESRPQQVSRALSNSFGFGGQNISLIFSKFQD